jgi:hypothetical protein
MVHDVEQRRPSKSRVAAGDRLLAGSPRRVLRFDRTRSSPVLGVLVVILILVIGGGCPRGGSELVDGPGGAACLSDPESVVGEISQSEAERIWAEGAVRDADVAASIAFWALLADAEETGRVHTALLSPGLYSRFLDLSFHETKLLSSCDDEASSFRSLLAVPSATGDDCSYTCSISWTEFRETLTGARGFALDHLLDRLKKSGQWGTLLDVASIVKDTYDAGQDWKNVLDTIGGRWDTVTVGDAIGAALSAGALVATIYGAGSVVALFGAVSLGLTIADEVAAHHEAKLECIHSCTPGHDGGGEDDGRCDLVWCVSEGLAVPAGCACDSCCSQTCEPSSDGDEICVCKPAGTPCSTSQDCCSRSCTDYLCA